MLKALIRTRLNALYSSFFYNSRFKKDRNKAFKIVVALFALYVIVSFLFMFGGFFYNICRPMADSGFAWLYFSIAAIMAVALCFVGSVFLTKAQLYDAQDNDLLMSMPIPPGYILLSRIIVLLVLNYIFEMPVLVPAGIVYCANYTPTATGIIVFIVELLILPLIPLTLSCIFGWLLAVISEKVRNKSFITTVMSLVFLGLYLYFFSRINYFLQALIQNIHSIGSKIQSLAFPVYHFGLAISGKNMLSLILFLSGAIIPFAIVYALLAHNFIKIATTKKGLTRKKYKEQPLKVGSVKLALLKKELRRFASSPMYILNASLGAVFTLAFAVAMIIYRGIPDFIVEDFPQIVEYANPLIITMLCFLTSTNFISAPSISLEGKNLWILQSFPVDGGDVLLAKAKMHMVVCLPPVFLASLSCIFTIKLSFAQILLTLLLPALVTVFCALFGVVINLHFPKFDWVNETVVVKQSMSSGIAMLASMAVIAVPAILYVSLFTQKISTDLYMFICAIILIALCLWMYRYLKTKGSAIFAFLGQ